jgi:hypothetical protein
VKVLASSFDDDIEGAVRAVFTEATHLISQYYVISRAKELFIPHKKNPKVNFELAV